VYVGNGGLSLRRTDPTISVLRAYESELKSYLSKGFDGIPGRNEDVFFATMSQISPNYTVPDPITASLFATEYPPSFYLKFNGGHPPMGGHAWSKFDPKFWLGLIDRPLGLLQRRSNVQNA
jgi:hypothetical protein